MTLEGLLREVEQDNATISAIRELGFRPGAALLRQGREHADALAQATLDRLELLEALGNCHPLLGQPTLREN